ncbi:MAG TPA: hypothetical protein EYH30_04635, partial [Anaerolineales bacterium]|nr:hypothetical protein [Anaerolineales bacterium]
MPLEMDSREILIFPAIQAVCLLQQLLNGLDEFLVGTPHPDDVSRPLFSHLVAVESQVGVLFVQWAVFHDLRFPAPSVSAVKRVQVFAQNVGHSLLEQFAPGKGIRTHHRFI